MLKLLSRATGAGFLVSAGVIAVALFIVANFYAANYVGDTLFYLFTGREVIEGFSNIHAATIGAFACFWIGFIIYFLTHSADKNKVDAVSASQ